MRLLAIDIGGTNSRFADCYYQSKTDFNIEQIFSIKTNQPNINSFQDLINAYETSKPESYLNSENYNLVSIAIAGPVNGKQSSPPNISWDINLDNIPSLPETVLLNDFAAQAIAFSIPDEQKKLDKIRTHNKKHQGFIAIIGAGTGLGHSMLIPVAHQNEQYQVLPSEAGQTCFTFTQDEKELESFILDKTKKKFAINDLIVSGTGISLIHEFLTKQVLSAKEVFAHTNNKETLNLFSRFYARACRNYCLSSCITDKLIVTGGIAAKHPELINSEYFINEFENMPSHQSMLSNIDIYLNRNEDIGLLGAAYYALLQKN